MMREAERLVDEFVALISHELRTPLTSIIGYLELTLDDANLTDEQRGYLGVVDHNADRLLRLVDDLLFVAQFEAGQLEARSGELDLAAVARQAVAEAQPSAVEKGITLTSDANIAAPVQADKGRMFRTLGNLVSNAIKFTPAGGDVRSARRLGTREPRRRLGHGARIRRDGPDRRRPRARAAVGAAYIPRARPARDRR